MKTGSGSRMDLESLKALVGQSGAKPAIVRTKRKKGSSIRQVLAALVANLGTINTGLVFGFSAVAIPKLKEPDSFIQIDEDQASWIASISAVSTPIGCILSGYLMDVIGRKRVLILTQFPSLLGWLLIAHASDMWMILVGRLLTGLGSGMVGAPARVYTAEATQPHLRGMLAAVASVGVSLGVMLEYGMGAVTGWNTLALLSAIIPALALLGSFFIPESPQWLVSVGREERCRRSLTKLRGRTCDVDHEANQIINFAHKNNIHKPSFRETAKGLLEPAALKPFFILTLYFLIYQFSGVNPVTFYAVEVFKNSGATIDKYLATVLLGVVRLAFTIVSCIMMRKYGRRPLTFISSIGCGITMIVLGGYMYMTQVWAENLMEPQMTWIPVAALFLFTIASVIGYLVVPWVMIGEVYPTQVRGIIGGMTTCGCHFFIFLVVKTYPMLQSLLSKHGAFILYGGISLAGTVFFYAYLPETKGRTLQEIEDYFSGRRKNLKSNPPSQHPSFINPPTHNNSFIINPPTHNNSFIINPPTHNNSSNNLNGQHPSFITIKTDKCQPVQ